MSKQIKNTIKRVTKSNSILRLYDPSGCGTYAGMRIGLAHGAYDYYRQDGDHLLPYPHFHSESYLGVELGLSYLDNDNWLLLDARQRIVIWKGTKVKRLIVLTRKLLSRDPNFELRKLGVNMIDFKRIERCKMQMSKPKAIRPLSLFW